MLVIVGFIVINFILGGVVNFGDFFYFFLKSFLKFVFGLGVGNMGDFFLLNNGVNVINYIDFDVSD